MPELTRPPGGAINSTNVGLFSDGVTIPVGSPLNTFGAWVEILAAIPLPSSRLVMIVGGDSVSPVTSSYLFNVAFGAPGSEVIIAEDMLATTHTNSNERSFFTIPLIAPAGTRVSVQCSASSAFPPDGLEVIGYLEALVEQSAISSPQGILTSYGENRPSSGGTSVDPGGVANVKGPWVELGTTGGAGIRNGIVGVGSQGKDFSAFPINWLIDIGYGPPGSEVVALLDYHVNATTGQAAIGPVTGSTMSIGIPANTRVAARARCSWNGLPLRNLDVILYGIS